VPVGTRKSSERKHWRIDYKCEVTGKHKQRVGKRKRLSQRAERAVDVPRPSTGRTPHSNGEPWWRRGLHPIVIVFSGIVAFASGLSSPFHGDDIEQIVINEPVHSISNIALFFQGGTFYTGHGLTKLGGGYYRPLATTVFSLIYTMFGAAPAAYHVVQIALTIASAIILYSIFKLCAVGSRLALFLSLVFLLHPVDSQVAFAIPWMQDALFFFFGILATYLLIRFRSKAVLAPVAICLFLSLLAKETAVLFILMDLVYLFWWNRQHLTRMIVVTVPFVGIWFALRASAVGLFVANVQGGPIGSVGLGGRLMTMPSIMALYLYRLIWPFKLASLYYFAHAEFTVGDFLIPLAIDIAVIWGVVGLGRKVGRRSESAAFPRTYWFFAAWTGVGLLAHLQLVPLDVTANEVWLHFSIVGLLGMVGTALTALRPSLVVRYNRQVQVACIGLLAVLGVATFNRGAVWSNTFDLASQDIANSPEDWAAYSDLAGEYLKRHDCQAVIRNEMHSVALHPTVLNLYNLGLGYEGVHDYAAAADAYRKGWAIGHFNGIADAFAGITAVYGDPHDNEQFLREAAAAYPNDAIVWKFLAYVSYRNGEASDAKQSISKAQALTPNDSAVQYFYPRIMQSQPLDVTVQPPGCGVS
jgi:tetratricopeptide (TPR) repeat protein